jgi:hypothetical protein
MNLSACRIPKAKPPPLPAHSDLVYNVQRRFLDLDGNGSCVVMDVWLERLASIPASVSRGFEHRYYRFDGKHWESFIVPELAYYPYALKAKNGDTFYIQAAIPEDVGDDIVLGDAAPTVFQVAPGRKQGLFAADSPSLTPFPGDPQVLLQALATHLAERLQAGQLTKEELTTVAPPLRADIEKRRIESLLKEAVAPRVR